MPEVHWQTCKNSNTLRAEVRPQLESSYLEVLEPSDLILYSGTTGVQATVQACHDTQIMCSRNSLVKYRCSWTLDWEETNSGSGRSVCLLPVQRVPHSNLQVLQATLGPRGSHVWHGSSSDDQKCTCTKRPAGAASYTRWAVTSRESALIWHHGNWTLGTRWLVQVIQWWWISAFGPKLVLVKGRPTLHLCFSSFFISVGSVYL